MDQMHIVVEAIIRKNSGVIHMVNLEICSLSNSISFTLSDMTATVYMIQPSLYIWHLQNKNSSFMITEGEKNSDAMN